MNKGYPFCKRLRIYSKYIAPSLLLFPDPFIRAVQILIRHGFRKLGGLPLLAVAPSIIGLGMQTVFMDPLKTSRTVRSGHHLFAGIKNTLR